jgi:hypothetical protein
MITFKTKGSFKNTEKFLNHAKKLDVLFILKKYGVDGVNALAQATPKDTGETASLWDYVAEVTNRGATLTWTNSNSEFGAPVAILIQYGHGTKNGGYVKGIDFINPAMKPIFEKIANDIFEEVSKI